MIMHSVIPLHPERSQIVMLTVSFSVSDFTQVKEWIGIPKSSQSESK